jgi:rubredoxin
MKPVELKRGDSCPACHGELKPAYVPTDDELRKALDKENPIVLPLGADNRTKEQRAELGELHRCGTCGYVTTFPAEAEEAPEPAEPVAADTRSGRLPVGTSRGSR